MDVYRRAADNAETRRLVAEAAGCEYVSVCRMELGAVEDEGVRSVRCYVSVSAEDVNLVSAVADYLQGALEVWARQVRS